MRYLVNIFLTLLVLLTFACNRTDYSTYIAEIGLWQDTLNLEFADSATSPLDSVDLILFDSLDFFPIDPKWRIEADFVRTPLEKPFFMKTTTDRLPVYVKFGIATFKIDGKVFKLNIYQNQELIKKPEYHDYLFVPFIDLTSGKQSYKGGRYIDLRIPANQKMIIDFNKAYNPYCAYNHRYSCPIPPTENFIDAEITAGVKKFSAKNHR